MPLADLIVLAGIVAATAATVYAGQQGYAYLRDHREVRRWSPED